jgi:predicted acylesterase/phospholipase RssA
MLALQTRQQCDVAVLLLSCTGLLTPEEVTARINKIKQWAESKRLMPGSTDPIILSDLVSPARTTDDPTILQWVNLVMAGGGMLGIAHVGFVRVLETAGVRFIGLGGASAGAINAALVAAVRKTPDDISWDTTQEVRCNSPSTATMCWAVPAALVVNMGLPSTFFLHQQ